MIHPSRRTTRRATTAELLFYAFFCFVFFPSLAFPGGKQAIRFLASVTVPYRLRRHGGVASRRTVGWKVRVNALRSAVGKKPPGHARGGSQKNARRGIGEAAVCVRPSVHFVVRSSREETGAFHKRYIKSTIQKTVSPGAGASSCLHPTLVI